MKKNLFIIFVIAIFLWLMTAPDCLDARGGSFGGMRGGGFGGGRSFGRSFGGSRSRTFSTPRTTPAPRTSFGKPSAPSGLSSVQRRTSFGGNRLGNASEYTGRYGVPRRTIPAGQISGIPRNYIVNDYGGFGHGLMMGYLMGHTSWMWYMPFHPAFYYSSPSYVENPDGTVSVYPPTFSWSKLIFTFIIIFAIIYIIYVIVRNRRRGRSGYYSQSSFS